MGDLNFSHEKLVKKIGGKQSGLEFIQDGCIGRSKRRRSGIKLNLGELTGKKGFSRGQMTVIFKQSLSWWFGWSLSQLCFSSMIPDKRTQLGITLKRGICSHLFYYQYVKTMDSWISCWKLKMLKSWFHLEKELAPPVKTGTILTINVNIICFLALFHLVHKILTSVQRRQKPEDFLLCDQNVSKSIILHQVF